MQTCPFRSQVPVLLFSAGLLVRMETKELYSIFSAIPFANTDDVLLSLFLSVTETFLRDVNIFRLLRNYCYHR